MAVKVWFRDDLRAQVLGVAVAALSSAVAAGAVNVEYSRGCLDTARSLSLSFGLDWVAVVGDIRTNLRAVGVLDVLEAAGVGLLDGGTNGTLTKA